MEYTSWISIAITKQWLTYNCDGSITVNCCDRDRHSLTTQYPIHLFVKWTHGCPFFHFLIYILHLHQDERNPSEEVSSIFSFSVLCISMHDHKRMLKLKQKVLVAKSVPFCICWQHSLFLLDSVSKCTPSPTPPFQLLSSHKLACSAYIHW